MVVAFCCGEFCRSNHLGGDHLDILRIFNSRLVELVTLCLAKCAHDLVTVNQDLPPTRSPKKVSDPKDVVRVALKQK